MKTLIIIPAYNEEASILKAVNRLKETNDIVDYVVINDGSTDNTREICLKNNICVIDLPFNLGIGGAVQTGYKYALYNDYDIAIQFDGDNQHNPKYISELVSEINKGNDMVIGSRYITDLSDYKSSRARQIGIKFLSLLIKAVTGKRIFDVTSGYRACNKELIKVFASSYPTDYPEPESITKVLKSGYKVSEIPVEMNEREHGKSSIGLIDAVYYMIKVSLCILMQSKN